MPEVWAAFAAVLVSWSVLTYLRLKRFLHILQLEEYFTAQFMRWLRANPTRYLRRMVILTLLPVVVAMVLASPAWLAAVAAAIWAGGGLALVLTSVKTQARKPLVMTARARRLLVTGLVVTGVVIALAAALAGAATGERAAVAAGLVAGAVCCAFAGHVLVVANLLLHPYEESLRRRFQSLASRKLREEAPKVIAITGSAGKTTTKDLVAHLLAARYRVLKTPSSFNTPMGISRTINDQLGGQEYFIVEMGAYKKGEIAKLCGITGGTDISVITTVNAQHLERFGSLERTAEAKFEIVDGLKQGSTAVLNFDVPAIRERAALYSGIEILSFGIESDDVRLRGSNVREQEGGIELDVIWGGESASIQVPLLGRHNAGNALAALGVGLCCGLDLGYMAAGVQRFVSPEHRLQPMRLPTGGIVLDDAYNANPSGIIGAIGVLGSYAPKRRILVTPGLIEMGSEKARYHAEVGKAAAGNVDVAILVGPKQTADICSAMLDAGFKQDSMHVVRSLDEAREALTKMGAGGERDVILYANDLPDQYDEFLRI